MVQMCKMIISPDILFSFKILIFQVVRGLKGQKLAQNDKKTLSQAVSQKLYIQAFIQALLSTAVFPQRFGFFSICLAQWLHGVAPW